MKLSHAGAWMDAFCDVATRQSGGHSDLFSLLAFHPLGYHVEPIEASASWSKTVVANKIIELSLRGDELRCLDLS